MIFLLVIVTIILMVYLGSVRTRTLKNPLTFFLLFWGFWVCFSLFNPYDLFRVSDKAYLLVWINMVSFSIGFITISRSMNKKLNIKFSLSNKTKKILLFVELCIAVVLIYYYIKFNAILETMLISDARMIRFQLGLLFSNYIEFLFFNYLITPVLYILILINIVEYSINKKKHASFLITLINIYLFAGIGLGRFVFFNTIIFLVIALSISKGFTTSKYNIKGVRLIKYIPLLVSGVYLMTVTTANRVGATIYNFESFWRWLDFSLRQSAIYFLGPFRALDSFFRLNSSNPFGFTLGRATLGGLEEIINNVFIILGINISTANSIMASFTVHPITIGYNGETFNAFYTGITNFYLDGGIAFVIIIPFIFGMIIASCWNLFNRSPNLYTFSILVFMVKTSIAYQYRWDFSTPSNWIVIIALYWLYRREKRYQSNYSIKKGINHI